MPIKLKIGENILNVDEKFAQVSQLLSELWSPGQDEELELNIKPEAFEVIKTYYEFNGFAPKDIETINNNPDQCFLNEHDKELIMKYDPIKGDELKNLLEAATYLQMNSFRRLCLARIAFEFYMDKKEPNKSFTDLKQKHNLGNLSLTLADVERQRKVYPSIIAKFQ